MEGKNKVIVYKDWGATFQKLTDEEAGKLIKHFFEYVNDNKPQGDRLTELLFEPIKQTLKRDLAKWEEKAERNRNNGKLGGRPKLEEKPKNPDGYLETQNNPEKPVSDSVSDSVSVIVEDKSSLVNNTDVLLTHKPKTELALKPKKEIPSLIEFMSYCQTIEEIDFNAYKFGLQSKYESWVDNKWKDGHNKPIKNWKTKIKNTIPFIKPINNGTQKPSSNIPTMDERIRAIAEASKNNTDPTNWRNKFRSPSENGGDANVFDSFTEL